MNIWTAALLVVSGFAAGVVNAVVGGAALFAFPVLMFVRLRPLAANATSVIALGPGQGAALSALGADLSDLGSTLVAPIFVGAAGGFLGALTLVTFGGRVFAAALPYLMAIATALFVFAPQIRTVLS